MKLDDMVKAAAQVEVTALVRQTEKQSCLNITYPDGGRHFIYLMDPVTKQVERKVMGPDGHIGACGGE